MEHLEKLGEAYKMLNISNTVHAQKQKPVSPSIKKY